MAWDATGDIVVVLPGITGSVLQRDGADVFGLTVGAGLRALFSAGGSIADLALDDDPLDRPALADGISASRLASDAHLVPGLWKIDGYGKVSRYLRRALKLEPGVDYQEFPYDWRRDNRVAALRLREESARWLHARRRLIRTPGSCCSRTRWADWSLGTSSKSSTAGATPAPSSPSEPRTAGP